MDIVVVEVAVDFVVVEVVVDFVVVEVVAVVEEMLAKHPSTWVFKVSLNQYLLACKTFLKKRHNRFGMGTNS